MNIERLAAVNNPAITSGRLLATGSIGGASVPIRGLEGSLYDDAMKIMRAGAAPGASAAEVAAARGVGGNLLASSMGGAFTQGAAGYFRGAQGMLGQAGLQGFAKKGALRSVVDLNRAINSTQILGKNIGLKATRDITQKSLYKQFGVKGLAKLGGTKAGAKFLAARAGAFAIPGLQVVAAASLIYDLGKMGGEIIKSGINLARDANMSMQGSMGKPLFGMGYRDTEAAATSRARGVMAIQNSRLNARSALGSEASMMAAHFG